MKHTPHFKQQGQNLVIVALAMLVFLAILGLVLDGGNAFSMRRKAQNAADAGALAAVRVLCEPVPNMGSPEEQAVAMGQYYAITQNKADGAQVSPNLAEKEVTVKATIDVDTFFIHLVGINQIPVEASATAGCFSPTLGRGVLPVAWSCREPVQGWGSDSQKCQEQRITWDTLLGYLAESPQVVHTEMYIVMDNQSYDNDLLCLEDDPVHGVLHCNLDGSPDGEPDWLASGGRSWLDLDGNTPQYECPPAAGEGSSELVEWINNGFGCDIPVNTWLAEQTGVTTHVFDVTRTRAQTNPLVIVPVYNDYCPDGDPSTNPPPPNCVGKWVAGDQIRPVSAQQPAYFRINSFAAFYITCVRRHNNDHCPGATRAIELNPDTLGQGTSFKSIEGYFLEGYIPGLSGREDCEGNDCPDLGVFTYYLSR